MAEIAIIEWNDAWSNDTEDKADNIIDEPLRMVSAGLLVRKTRAGVLLAVDYAADSLTAPWRHFHFFPKGMIRKIKILEY